MATATYDRPSIFRDAWARARRAAAEAAEPVRRFIGAGMRAAWASAKSALRTPVKPAAPAQAGPVQLDLIEFIASLPPVPPAPRRFVMGAYTTITVLGPDGEDDVTVTLAFADGTVRTLGAVAIYSEDYDGPQAVLEEALRVIEEAREAMALPVVQQPKPAQVPEPEPQVKAVSHMSDRLAELARERDEYRAGWLEYRRERIAIVNGEMEGDPGIAWTNEERAEARFDDAVERYEEAYQDEWRSTAAIAA